MVVDITQSIAEQGRVHRVILCAREQLLPVPVAGWDCRIVLIGMGIISRISLIEGLITNEYALLLAYRKWRGDTIIALTNSYWSV